jgi:RNA polymerase sigma-B factor
MTAVATVTASQHSLTPNQGASVGADDLQQLFVRWQRHSDQAAREELVRRFMPLTRSLARRYGRSSEPFEDLLQVASLGLLKALDRFEDERGHSFQSFAIPTILGEMRRYFRDCGWAVHVPRGAQERALKVRDAQEQLSGEHGRAPTVSQLAQYLELDGEEVLDALQATQAYETMSLDTPRPGAEEDAMTYGETVGSEDERYERAILRMRFVEDLTQTEIAGCMGISQMQVSRLLRRTLEQLRVLTRATEGVA